MSTSRPTIYKIKNPFPYLKIENIYNDEELRLIWQELDFLTHPQKLKPPEKTYSAKDNHGNVLKNNSAIFLEDTYTNRELSNILTINRKIFTDPFVPEFADLNFAYNLFYHTNFDSTMISYYENGGYYKPHFDGAVYTILTWFFREPKQFTGGNFSFSDFNEKIEIQNNMTVIFPSFVNHSVEEVKMEKSDFSGYGRYCMTQFVYMNSNIDMNPLDNNNN